METTVVILYASIFSVLVPLIISLKVRKQIKEPTYNFIGWILLVSLISDLTSLFLVKNSISNFPVTNIYVIVSFTLFSIFYSKLLPFRKKLIYVILFFFINFFLYNTFLVQGFYSFQGYTRALGGLIMVFYSYTYFSSLLKNLPCTDIKGYGLFWINTGTSFYFSFNLLLFVFSSYVFENLTQEASMYFWSFHNVNNIIKNILFCVGIYYAGKP
jgi:hypothetical protein